VIEITLANGEVVTIGNDDEIWWAFESRPGEWGALDTLGCAFLRLAPKQDSVYIPCGAGELVKVSSVRRVEA
jgi:hypothetical protein